ncbi:MAG: glycosyltransferase family 4 protein [Candidatus Methylomirabilaceae bacterium]
MARTTPHRVLHLLGTAGREGTAQVHFVLSLARGLDSRKYELHAWFLGGDGPLSHALSQAGVQVRAVPWEGVRRDPLGTVRFWRALRGGHYSIIHQHWGGRSVRWVAQKVTGARIVTHLHARTSGSSDPRPIRYRLSNTDVTIAVGQAVAECAPGVRPLIIYPSVEVPSGQPGSSASEQRRGRVVGTACWLTPIKGVRHLIAAIAVLRPSMPDVRLEIAGAGPDQSALESEVRLQGLEESVKFLGWQEEIGSVMARWDVYAQPSLEEGFGLAVLEAMAAGLPVVASRVGGLPELVEEGRTGWLVPPANPAALAERLRQLLLDPAERHAFGEAGRARARDVFSPQRMVASMAAVYDDLVASEHAWP